MNVSYNAANRKDVRAAEKALALSSIINREVICGIMQVQNGRQWMYERLASAYVFADPFSPDPAIHAYQAGLRAQAILLFNDIILHAADSFTLMIREANERAAASERTRSPNGNGRVEEPDPADRSEDGRFDPDLGYWTDEDGNRHELAKDN